MLIQLSVPGSFEADFNSVSGIGKKDFVSHWMPGDECRQKCLRTEQPWSGCQETVTELEMNSNGPCSSTFPGSFSAVSTFSAASRDSTPAFVYRRRKSQRSSAAASPAQVSNSPLFVYKRRKAQRNCAATLPAPTSTTPTFVYCRRKHKRNMSDLCLARRSQITKITNGCHPVIISGAHSVAMKEHVISDVVGRNCLDMLSVQRINRVIYSKSESFTGFPSSGRPFPEENLRSCNPGALDTCCIIDCCSSTKSNLDLDSAPLKTDVDDLGECSSGTLADERMQDAISERAVCTSVTGSQRLLDKVPLVGVRGSTEDSGLGGENCFSLLFKVCEHPGEKLKMIDCHNREDAFRLPCHKPPLEKTQTNDWLSDSCNKKKRKLLEKPTSFPSFLSSEIERDRDSTSEDESGPISLMLRETKPYKTKVRIGSEFQAEVADWSGPNFDEVDPVGEPLEIVVAGSLHGLNYSRTKKPPRISSIGNWLQCQEVIQGIGEADEIICGKWRRAPLFEVQTDNWECFRCILWDPYHADCSVPQELDTDEVIKQLKYMETLRPQLAARRCKADRSRTTTTTTTTNNNSLCLIEL